MTSRAGGMPHAVAKSSAQQGNRNPPPVDMFAKSAGAKWAVGKYNPTRPDAI